MGSATLRPYSGAQMEMVSILYRDNTDKINLIGELTARAHIGDGDDDCDKRRWSAVMFVTSDLSSRAGNLATSTHIILKHRHLLCVRLVSVRWPGKLYFIHLWEMERCETSPDISCLNLWFGQITHFKSRALTWREDCSSDLMIVC